jgi:hypothetical protein
MAREHRPLRRPLDRRAGRALGEADVGEEIASTIPHRARDLPLVHSLGRALNALHEERIDEVERGADRT